MVEAKPTADQPTQDAAATANPEEEEKKFIYHGMANVANKNTVQDLQSKKKTWQQMEIPSNIEAGLAKLHYFKPSII